LPVSARGAREPATSRNWRDAFSSGGVPASCEATGAALSSAAKAAASLVRLKDVIPALGPQRSRARGESPEPEPEPFHGLWKSHNDTGPVTIRKAARTGQGGSGRVSPM